MPFPDCPFCENSNCELVEKWSENFQRLGIAVECPDCGLSGPACDEEDDPMDEEKMAIRLWNLIYCKELWEVK